MAKSENREAGFIKRRASLFKKAHELAVLCDAQIAIIIISSHGKVYEFATSSCGSMQEILTRYKMCNQFKNRNALQLNQEKPGEEVPKEAGQKADELKSKQKLFGKDLTGMSSHELYGLVEKLKEGMLFIKDTKIQLLKNELEKSRMQEQQVVQKNQMLQRQVQELHNFYPRVYYPMPISIHCPATERDRGLLPYTDLSAQLAITSSSEPEQNASNEISSEQNASNEISPPSTTSAAPTITDSGSPTQRDPQKPADKDGSNNHSGSNTS